MRSLDADAVGMNVILKSDRPQRALLAESDPVVCALCQRALTEAGFAVVSVDSGAGAVAIARDNLPDLILISHQLRDVPAPEAIRWLRSNEKLDGTPIIVLGGKADHRDASARADAVTIVSRPISVQGITHAITRAVRVKKRGEL